MPGGAAARASSRPRTAAAEPCRPPRRSSSSRHWSRQTRAMSGSAAGSGSSSSTPGNVTTLRGRSNRIRATGTAARSCGLAGDPHLELGRRGGEPPGEQHRQQPADRGEVAFDEEGADVAGEVAVVEQDPGPPAVLAQRGPQERRAQRQVAQREADRRAERRAGEQGVAEDAGGAEGVQRTRLAAEAGPVSQFRQQVSDDRQLLPRLDRARVPAQVAGPQPGPAQARFGGEPVRCAGPEQDRGGGGAAPELPGRGRLLRFRRHGPKLSTGGPVSPFTPVGARPTVRAWRLPGPTARAR